MSLPCSGGRLVRASGHGTFARALRQAPLIVLLTTAPDRFALAQQAEAQPGGAAATLRGGVPSGALLPGEISLTIDDAIERGLRSNLAALLAQTGIDAASAARREALGDLLPQLRLGVSEVREKVNLAAFGFSGAGIPGIPQLVGPFEVFDARATLQQSLFDLHALHRLHGARDLLEAARQDAQSARDLVVLTCGGLYVQALAGESRIEAARAQLKTAETLLSLARDRQQSGLGAGIEALRADVQAQSLRQRLIVAEQDAARQKLSLARAIGLPLGQRYRLADPMPRVAGVPMTPEAALERALRERPDVRAQQARLAAALEAVRAAKGEALPSLAVSGDIGAIGNDPAGALRTYTMAAALRVPVFEGGRAFARASAASARLVQEQARLADLRASVYYEVQAVFLDLRAAEERVRVADSALDLARRQLEQARDRFSAGVADNLELVQAQEALAGAEESRISSVFAHDLARLSLARTLGGAEASYGAFLKGQ